MRFFVCANPPRSISRPQWLHASPCRRHIHSLLEAAFPSDVHPLAPSRREIIDFFPADFYEKASKVHVRVRTYKDSKMHDLRLEHALLKFGKPGHLFLPIPQRPWQGFKEPPQYYFKPMDMGTFREQIDTKQTHSKIIDIFPERENLLAFETRMVKTWLLLKAGIPIQMQIHNNGPKDIENLRKMCKMYICLRPDVILSAMPHFSDIIIDPQTDHQKVCWVMGGPLKDPERLAWVKPLNKTDEYYKRRNEVIDAAMDLEECEAQQEEDRAGYLSDDDIAGSGTAGTLSPEEQEWEEYKRLEVLTGMRPPPG